MAEADQHPMWHDLASTVSDSLGFQDSALSAGEMLLRAVVIYTASILYVRLGEKRFMGKNTALDLILGIIIGSVLSRAITGNAPLWPTLVAGAALVALHALFAVLSFHSAKFGHLVKGGPRVLIRDGQIDWEQMRRGRITRHDLDQALHEQGSVTDPSQVALARLERNGKISVLTKSKPAEPRVLEVKVEAGVQIVRVRLE